MKPFSLQVVTAITEVVTGGSGTSGPPPIGYYRSGPQLARFFGALNIELRIGNASRVPTVHDTLAQINRHGNGAAALIRVMESVADPREYIDKPEKLTAVVEYLNKRLEFDGFELRKIGTLYKVTALGTGSVAGAALRTKVDALDLPSVREDFERALEQAERDPPDAITGACATLESVCKCILDDLGKPYPSAKDVKGLNTELAKHLMLSTGRQDLEPEWEQDIKMILQALATCVQGIGSLRTKAGDAHGRGKKAVRADARVARLAIHAASTLALFYLETWQKMSGGSQKA